MRLSGLRLNSCHLPTCEFPKKMKLNCSPQELKEGIAHEISSHCHSSRHLQQLHARAISAGLRYNLHICSLLMTKYFSFQDVGNARRVFDDQNPRPTKTLFWNTFMRGCLRNGQARSALDVYCKMNECSPEPLPDSQTFNLVITACTDLLEFELGSQVHSCIRCRGLESHLLVATALISFYCKEGDLKTAYELFERMPTRDAVSWNAIISGFSRNGSLCEAMTMFKRMSVSYGIIPTEVTLVSLVSACGDLCSLETGQVLHGFITKIGSGSSQFILNSLMKMYIDCGCLDCSSRLFNGLMLKDAVSWSTMIGGYARHGRSDYAIELFHQMVSSELVQPTRPILLNVLLACADLGDWHLGQSIEEDYLRSEENRFESDTCLSTALIYMYAKCGRMDISLKLLNDVLVVRNEVIAWNALFKAHAERGEVQWASELMLKMQRSGINPDPVTFLTLLTLFSSTPLLSKGMEVHAHVIKRGFELERPVANSLVEMYAKCGHIEDSHEVFHGIEDKDVVSWSSMIKAYAWNGNGEEALRLFQLMRETETKPNHITFVAILSACSHAGYVQKGRDLFTCMKEEHGLEPSLEHYACMVDLFCRAGHLLEAYGLLKDGKPMACTSAVLWGTLLSACRVQCNWLIGEAAARKLLYLEPANAANYRMLAEIYISAGQREDANGLLQLLRAKGLGKNPGFSWIESG